jgi:hypothetical protein
MRDLVLSQAKVKESLQKKLAANNKSLETILAKMYGISSAIKNQLSFNKMLETQLAQLAAAVPSADTGKIPGQLETTLESVNVETTRWGKLPPWSLMTNHTGKPTHQWENSWQEPARKYEDLGYPVINCSLGDCYIDQALCDLGASISIMPKVIFERLNYAALSPTLIRLQLATRQSNTPRG